MACPTTHELVLKAVQESGGDMKEVLRRVAELKKGLSKAEQEQVDRDLQHILTPLPPGFREDGPPN